MVQNEDIEKELYQLAKANHDEFAGLARCAGLNPKKDFVGSDLRGCDFSNQDLRDFDLRDADMRHCRFYKTIFLNKHIRGAKFSTKMGYQIVTHAGSETRPLSFSTADLRYTDAIAFIIEGLSTINEPNKKRDFLNIIQARDDRRSIQRLISSAQTSEITFSADHMAVPHLMNLALSNIYPLARGDLIHSFIKVIGRNKHAHAYLHRYYKERARGPNVTGMLREYLEEAADRAG